ncbi:putative ionotropic receptor IR75p [Danaus plexippus plexippus]|uniref:Ionotropic receptor IR75p n=1 Tax=Danaus plexippus plexippus TaxID=278856 RepID=A0A212FC55_DANPL|nr:putative ionotropic receptor IR75p [Danaus plexippus plexippus]
MQRLKNCYKFRTQTLQAQTIIVDLIRIGNFTTEAIKSLNHNPKCKLQMQRFDANHCDAYINKEDVNPIQEIVIEEQVKIEKEFINEQDTVAMGYTTDDSLPLETQRTKAKKTKKKKEKKIQEPKVDRRRKPFLNDDLNESLFTITDLTLEEQIADIQKRQESSNFKNSVYKCMECFKGFLDEGAYNGHMTRHTTSVYGVMEDYRGVRMLPVSARRRDLRKHNLTMANVITDSNETRQHLDDRLNLHQDSITKMSYVVAKICFDMLNATENRIFTHTWGYKDKNGNWQGIIDHLLKKKADLGTLTIFTQERMKAIDYIAMVGSTAVRFVFREPPLALLENIFTLPFTSAVWIAIGICVLGCAVFLYITSKWEATVGMHPLQLSGSWADVLILIIGAVLQQGCTLEPRYAAGRCVTLLLFVSLTVLFAAYSANIVVLLRAPSSSVRSLPDLLNSPLKLGASDFEYNRYFFKKLNDPIRKAIYSKKIAPSGKKPNFYSMKEGVEKIRKGLFAFHMELNPGYRLIQETYQEEEKCDLVEIDYINEIDPWLPGQKRSPYKDLFKISFIKIRESGVQSCVHRRLHVGRPRCSGSVSTFSSVGITDMYPALQATLYGAVMSVAVLMMEKVHYKLFIDNEKKSTIVILDNICWDKSFYREIFLNFIVSAEMLKLIKALSRNNVRVSCKTWNKNNLQDHMLLFLTDLDCPGAEESLKLSPYLRYPFRWLALTKRSDDIKYIWKLPLFVDSDFVLAKEMVDHFSLTELYKPSTFGPMSSIARGYYNGSLIDTRENREIFRRRKDIMGHPLTISNVIQDSNTSQYHIIKENRLELHYDGTTKLSYVHVQIAFQMLNATPRHVFSHRWGYKKNGQWSGMINDINTGRADLGTNCVPAVERLSVVVFTDCIANFEVKFIFRQPPLSYVSNIFTLPFSKSVWIAIATSFAISTITIYIATKWEVRTFKTAQKDPIRKAIYRKISPEKGKENFYNFNEGVELLRQGLFAFHAILELVYLRVEETFLENEKCDLMQLDFINSHDPFVPVYKHSPYLELLRVVFKRIRESGIQMANHRRFQVPKPRCTEKISTFSSVGIVHMKPVLLFITYGFLAAFLIMVAEIFVFRMKMFKRKELKYFSLRNRPSKENLTIKYPN